MKLDISPLEKAITQIETALRYAESPMAVNDRGLYESLRAGAIQAFECAYELSWKTLKCFIEANSPSESETDETTFDDLLRVSFEYGLIQDVKMWFKYRDERNTVGVVYREDKAAQVYSIIPDFLADIVYLLNQIRLFPQPNRKKAENPKTIKMSMEWMSLTKKILKLYVPGRRVAVFGSRATGIRLKPHSDIDLCIMGDTPVDSDTLWDLRNTFSASRLPMRVDILNWSDASPILRENIIEQAQDIT